MASQRIYKMSQSVYKGLLWFSAYDAGCDSGSMVFLQQTCVPELCRLIYPVLMSVSVVCFQ